MTANPATARKLLLDQIEAFEAYNDDDDFGRSWCRCHEAFRKVSQQDPHCHVHRHVRVFREEVERAFGTVSSELFDPENGKVADWMEALESKGCICHEAYKGLGVRDPYCQVHSHVRVFKGMAERALHGPHCRDCPGPYCPYDMRAYDPKAPDPKWECSWATTGIWPERPEEPEREPSPMVKKVQAFLDAEFPDREKRDA